MAARNITLSLPDEVVRRAKVLAAQRDTSVSALVSALLTELVDGGSDYQQAWVEEEAFMASGALQVGTITWTRDDLHRN